MPANDAAITLIVDCFYELEDAAWFSDDHREDQFQATVSVLKRKLNIATKLLNEECEISETLTPLQRCQRVNLAMELISEAAHQSSLASVSKVPTRLDRALACAVRAIEEQLSSLRE